MMDRLTITITIAVTIFIITVATIVHVILTTDHASGVGGYAKPYEQYVDVSYSIRKTLIQCTRQTRKPLALKTLKP